MVFCADCVGDFKVLQSRQFSSVPFDHAWNMRPEFGVEDQLKAYKDYKIHFAGDMGFTCLHYTIDSTITLWFCSCTAVLMHTSSAASFSNYGIFVPKVRVLSSSIKQIINIVDLCSKVDSPLECTSEGNRRVQYVDQVQNPTKNPFAYLMSTVAFFSTPDDLLFCLFLFNF